MRQKRGRFVERVYAGEVILVRLKRLIRMSMLLSRSFVRVQVIPVHYNEDRHRQHLYVDGQVDPFFVRDIRLER